MRKIETLIIGAGVTGLAYANFCEESYLIVEKEKEPGGLCRTFYEDDFVWDYAGHFFHFATEELKSYFEKRISKEDMVSCVKNTKIYYADRLVDYPFQMNIHQLPQGEFIDCLYDLFHREDKKEFRDFEEMLYGKFGKSITEKFLKPYNEKLYACKMNSLDSDAMGRFFPYANPEDIINNMKENTSQTYNSTFDYPKKGAVSFINALTANISKEKLLLNSSLEQLDIEKKIAIVNGEEIMFEHLISTMPLNYFVKYLSPEIREMMNDSLHANKVLVFNLGFDKKSAIKDVHWIYFPDKSLNFYRAGFYDNILGTDKLSMYVEIGFGCQDEVNVQKELEQTLEGLKRCGIIDEHKLLCYNSVMMDPAYVHITEDSKKKVELLKIYLQEKDIYTIGRYGSWTYCSIEDSMKEAIAVAERGKK